VRFDTNDFDNDVIGRSHTVPVLVDFWAAWCAPCKVLGPILEKLARESDGRWELAKLDTEKFPAVASRFGIQSIPNVKLFVDGQVTEEFVGALPESKVTDWLRKALPGRYDAQLEGARSLLRQNSPIEAREILEFIVVAESDNDQAFLLLAQTHLGTDPEHAARTVDSIEMGSQSFEEAEAIRLLAAMFKRAEAQDSFARDSVRDLYLTAIDRVRSNDLDAALNGFIEVIRKKRYFDDDGSRKACLAIFKLLGEDHEVTRRYRPALSAALY
jgi:putative thioredoxin